MTAKSQLAHKPLPGTGDEQPGDHPLHTRNCPPITITVAMKFVTMMAFSIPAMCVALMAVILATALVHRCTGIRMVGGLPSSYAGEESASARGNSSSGSKPSDRL